MSFRVHSKDLLGRVGTLTSKSGAFETPHMFPVLDPNHRLLEPQFFDRAAIKAVMTNAYLLKRSKKVSDVSDVHETLRTRRTVATDSGAYQILEYGGVNVKPNEIIRYQESINTDIGVILDIPTGFRSTPERARWTVDETVRRADQALKFTTRKDILWMGPIQGGVHIEEVRRSAAEMSLREFPIYALGSPTELMESQRFDILVEMIIAAKTVLPKSKPFHLFGAGHPALFPFLVALGCDTFDSAAYALYARVGRYLTSEGTQLLPEIAEFACTCPACVDTSPSELLIADPGERELRLTQHNLWACFSELRRIREAIRRGRLWELLEVRSRVHPSFADCFERIRSHASFLEESTPSVKPHGIFHLGDSSENRPEVVRYHSSIMNSIVEKRKLVLLLPGRWRRPFHEDPRYQVVVNHFDEDPKISICFYSPWWGAVPIELDETFPIAQTEGRDLSEPDSYDSKAEHVARFVETSRSKGVIVVSHGDFGRVVASKIVKTVGRKMVTVIDGEKLKPLGIIRTAKRRVARGF